MNIAMIIGGGSGQRMKNEIPKQFLNVNDKPVILYTMEAFQKHPDIDEIGVVCIEGWNEILKAYARQFHIEKLKQRDLKDLLKCSYLNYTEPFKKGIYIYSSGC